MIIISTTDIYSIDELVDLADNGKIIGYIETDTVTGNKVGRNFYNKIIGRYNKADDKTRD